MGSFPCLPADARNESRQSEIVSPGDARIASVHLRKLGMPEGGKRNLHGGRFAGEESGQLPREIR